MKNVWIVFGVLAVGCGGGSGGSKINKVRVACATNLQKLHTSMIAYASDNDDVFPNADWTEALTPYLPASGASFTCPALPAGSFGYAYNGSLIAQSIHIFPSPDETPLFFDSSITVADAISPYPTPLAGRHGGENVIYISGRTLPEIPRSKADTRAVCVGNLKKVATAMALYANDNDDLLPPATWNDALEPYVTGNGNVFRCPAVAEGSYGYAYNSAVVGLNLTTVDSPATTPSFFDSSILTRNATSTYVLAHPARHGGDVTAFLDGHVSQ